MCIVLLPFKRAAAIQQSILAFGENGFLVTRNYPSPEQVAAVNKEIDALVKSNTVQPGHRNKIMFAIHHAALLGNIACCIILRKTPFVTTKSRKGRR